MSLTAQDPATAPLLQVRDLSVRLGPVAAVTDLSFDVHRGEFLGIVGESGSGKSVTAKAILGLLPHSADIRGSVKLEGEELLGASAETMRGIRGNRIGLVFQDALAALDPVYTIGDQLVEALRAHTDISKRAARKVAADLLGEVKIPKPAERLDSYPHQLSGGQRQRIIIAAALIAEPDLIIADEPTTALDVTVQKQVLDLLAEVCQRRGASVMLVTHDLGVVAQTCDRVATFYGGLLVEEADVFTLFDGPRHPYTSALLRSVPRLGQDTPFQAIPGSPAQIYIGLYACPFAPRCEHAEAVCTAGVPPEFREGERRHRCVRVGRGEL
ncbi:MULTISPECIES: ABC transporter ATP-binding protein [unclassified Ornithinimicrobium]|uniref:ABC transporter ATP-binding protein n=1 Tax=unclassified Ornithinimicrobium TaxID=2615080 RepID=UPI003852ABFB